MTTGYNPSITRTKKPIKKLKELRLYYTIIHNQKMQSNQKNPIIKKNWKAELIVTPVVLQKTFLILFYLRNNFDRKII